MMAEREFSALRFVSYRNLLKSFYQRRSMIPKPVKKLEKLFIAPKVRQVLYETSQRVFTRCACARRTGFLIKFLIKNQYQITASTGIRWRPTCTQYTRTCWLSPAAQKP